MPEVNKEEADKKKEAATDKAAKRRESKAARQEEELEARVKARILARDVEAAKRFFKELLTLDREEKMDALFLEIARNEVSKA